MIYYEKRATMKDRRRLKRKYLAFFTRVYDRNTGLVIGHLADLSPGGMMLISDTPIEVDTVYALSMDLSEAFFEKDHLDFNAHSKWCQPDIDPAFWNTGFELLTPAPEDLGIVQQIIDEYGIRE